MTASLEHLRLILAQTLYEIRWRVVNDYTSASAPIVASDSDLQTWVDRTKQKLNDVGASPDPTLKDPNGGLQLLYQFLTEDERDPPEGPQRPGQPLIYELSTVSTWWAAADRGRLSLWPFVSVRQQQLDALSSARWHLKRAKAIGIAERAGESAGIPWFWEAAKDLATAVGNAAQRF